MNNAVLLLALSVAPSATLETGTELTYEGNFIAEKGDPIATEKKFTLTVLVAEAREQGATVLWTIEERGRGGWSWLSRFGLMEVAQNQRAGGDTPALLYQRPEGNHVIPMLAPLLYHETPLAEGVSWVESRLNHKVAASGKVKDQAAWRVEVSNAYGRRRLVMVDKQSAAVLSLNENVFIGQGEKHLLQYKLESSKRLGPDEVDAAIAGFDSLSSLRAALDIEPQTRDIAWTNERLTTLKKAVPELTKKVTSGPLARIAAAAASDAKNQKNRAGAVAAMRDKLLGNPSPRPDLSDVKRKAFNWEQTKGKVTVLHFWEYRDTPLEEPYGQVAYLDFLYRNRKSSDVEVFGVAVNQRLLDPSTRTRAVLSAKKLRSFMNLSYPLLFDTNGGLRAFGDPRITGAKLPLVVVIDKEGKVSHHHVGHYEVDRQRGLLELDKAVTEALGTAG